MTLNVIYRVRNELIFLYLKNDFMILALRRLLYNALM